MTIYTHIESPLGRLLVTSAEGKLTGLYFADRPHARIAPGWTEQADAEIFVQTKQELEEYALGKRKRFDLAKVSLTGTPAQLKVWEAIAAIPFGLTMTYTELAQKVGTPDAVRAVGGATGRNPVSWIIPCHRVMGKDGALTGYAGGVERKKALLEFEAAKAAGKEAVLALAALPVTS
jgi:methylated-DNA-[protein]-cysteine S-methyltransferase